MATYQNVSPHERLGNLISFDRRLDGSVDISFESIKLHLTDSEASLLKESIVESTPESPAAPAARPDRAAVVDLNAAIDRFRCVFPKASKQRESFEAIVAEVGRLVPGVVARFPKLTVVEGEAR